MTKYYGFWHKFLQTIRHLKRVVMVGPAPLLPSPIALSVLLEAIHTSVDTNTCDGCETRTDRCQVDAIQIENDLTTFSVSKFIGCGLGFPLVRTNLFPPRINIRVRYLIFMQMILNWCKQESRILKGHIPLNNSDLGGKS